MYGGVLDTVLGVSVAPTAVRMVLVEGENGDGATVDEDNFALNAEAAEPDAVTANAAEQVISAILGTREGAAEGGYQLASTGVTWTDPIQAAALRDALVNRKIENVMLVSAFLAAAALAQAVGNATNYAHTALLFIEPDTATLAVVDSADGSIADIHRQPLPDDDDVAVAQLTDIVSGVEELETHPDAVFLVGSDVDIPLIKPTLEAATSLPVTAPEEPETALARGAALASANTPLFVSSTAARAYAQDPGTGGLDPYTLDAAYFEDVADAVDTGDGALAYSAVPDSVDHRQADRHERKSFALIGSVLASIFVIGVAALVAALAISIRSTSGVRPDPGHNVVAPTPPALEAPAPAPQAPAPVPQAPAPVPQAPAPVPQAPAPVPQAPAPVPQAPAPMPVAPAPVPVPAPAAPAPGPVPIPIPVQIPGPPIIGPQLPFDPPGRGGGGGRGGGKPPGIGKFPGGGKPPDIGKLPGGGKFPGGKGGGGRGGFNIPGIPGL